MSCHDVVNLTSEEPFLRSHFSSTFQCRSLGEHTFAPIIPTLQILQMLAVQIFGFDTKGYIPCSTHVHAVSLYTQELLLIFS